MKLGAGEHFEWLAFRKVNTGRVIRQGDGGYLDQGRPIGTFLAEIVGELLEEGLLQVTEPDPPGSVARVILSDAGATRYSELCRRQRARSPAPVADRTVRVWRYFGRQGGDGPGSAQGSG